METNQNQKDLEACIRTFKKLAYKIDEMNTKLTHIIDNLREHAIKKQFEEPEPYKKFFEEYDKYDQLDDEDMYQ